MVAAVAKSGESRVRGWRVKGRDVLGPVDTAESPEPSGAKIRADEDISSRERLNGETEARPRLLFATLRSPATPSPL